MAKMHLLNEYNMPIYDNSLSYWAMHFISVLECLMYHKNLEFPAIRIEQSISSLALMKGNYPNSFFDKLSNYIKNWGMQYFMVHFLNHKMSLNIVDNIKNKLDYFFNIPNYQDYDDFEFYISGHDTELSKNLDNRYDEIYPNNFDFNFIDKDNLIANSDICLILKNNEEDRNIAIFGEIEGNHGDKLFNDSFWFGKSNYCVLGIGAVEGHQKGKFYIEAFLFLGKYPKINLLFEKNNYVIRDFWAVISEFQSIFNYAAKYRNHHISNFSYIVNEVIVKNWNEPILDVLNILYELKDNRSNLLGEIDKGEIKLIMPMDN